MPTVISSNLPAPLPISAMAGVTNPTIMRGIIKPRNCPKMLLKVINMRTHGSVSMFPSNTPRAMAAVRLIFGLHVKQIVKRMVAL